MKEAEEVADVFDSPLIRARGPRASVERPSQEEDDQVVVEVSPPPSVVPPPSPSPPRSSMRDKRVSHEETVECRQAVKGAAGAVSGRATARVTLRAAAAAK